METLEKKINNKWVGKTIGSAAMIVAGFSLAYFGGPEWAAAYTPSPELAQVRPLTYSMTSFFRQAGYFTGGFVSAWGLLGLLGTYCDRFPKKKN